MAEKDRKKTKRIFCSVTKEEFEKWQLVLQKENRSTQDILKEFIDTKLKKI